MYNQFHNQTNLANERQALSRTEGDEILALETPISSQNFNGSYGQIRDAPKQSQTYNVKLQVKKKAQVDINDQELIGGRQFQASVANVQTNLNPIDQQLDKVKTPTIHRGGGVSGLYNQSDTQSDPNDQKKYKRISDKMQDHQRFFKNLIELPNNNSAISGSVSYNNNLNNAMAATQEDRITNQQAGFVKKPSSGQQTHKLFDNNYQGAMKASHAYGGGGAVASNSNQEMINGVNVGQMKIDSASSVYSGKNGTSQNQRVITGKMHQGSKYLSSHETMPIYDNKDQSQLQSQAVQIQYFANRSRLSQSSQKKAQSRIANAGADAVGQGQQYTQQNNQINNNDKLKQVSISGKNTMSPQILNTAHHFGIQNGSQQQSIYPQINQNRTDVVALNRTQADFINQTADAKEIYETLNKSKDEVYLDTNKTGSLTSQTNNKNVVSNSVSQQSYQPKQGHQAVSDELRQKYYQFHKKQDASNSINNSVTMPYNFNSRENSNMMKNNKFAGVQQQPKTSGGINQNPSTTNFDQITGRIGSNQQNCRVFTGAIGLEGGIQSTPPMLDVTQKNKMLQQSSSRQRETGGDIKLLVESAHNPSRGIQLSSTNAFTNGPIGQINPTTISSNNPLASPKQQFQNTANQMVFIKNGMNETNVQQMKNRPIFSRSQSRAQKQDFGNMNKSQGGNSILGQPQNVQAQIIQNNQQMEGKYQFNQYKNVININCQLERGFSNLVTTGPNSTVTGGNQVQLNNRNALIGVISNQQIQGGLASIHQNNNSGIGAGIGGGQFGSGQTRLNNFKAKAAGIPIIFKNKDGGTLPSLSVTQANSAINPINGTHQQQQVFFHSNTKSQGPPLQQQKLKENQKLVLDDEDDKLLPIISQNHYRHIHEQRDFTLENLSQAGETEEVLYDDFKIFTEFEWQLDFELQELITKHNQEAKEAKRNKSQEKPTKKQTFPFTAAYKCRSAGEPALLRLKCKQSSMNLFIKLLEAFDQTSKENQIFQNLISLDPNQPKQEYTLLNREQQFIYRIKEEQQYEELPPSIDDRGGVEPLPTTISQQLQSYQSSLIQLYKKLDNICRVKVKYGAAIQGVQTGQNASQQSQHVMQYLQQEAKDYARSQAQLLAKLKILLNSKGSSFFMRRQQEGSNGGGYFNDLDADNIINGVRIKQSGEYGEDGNGDLGQTCADIGKGKKKGDILNIKDPAALKKSAFIQAECQALLNENVNGIPAKEIKLAKILMDKPAPHCSAQSWAIYDQKTNTLLFGKLERERREAASLTKIMTCFVVFKLLDKFKMEDTTLVQVGVDAVSVIGTSAELLEGDTLTVRQLIYGLMLPSGNDAAHQLAEFFGTILKKATEEEEEKVKQEEKERADNKLKSVESNKDKMEEANNDNLSSSPSYQQLQTQDKETNAQSSSSDGAKGNVDKNEDEIELAKRKKALGSNNKELPHIRKSVFVTKQSQFRNYQEVLFFLEEMNKTAEELNLKGSFYDSPHGLSNSNNRTTALDLAKLCTQAMKIPKFKEIVGTKFYQIKKNTNGNRRTYKWYNTHLMLGQRGINGIKTGITPAAGPCLATSLCNDGIELVIIIICTKNMDIRWSETWKLANWAIQRLKTIEKFQNHKAQKGDTAQDQIQHKRLLNRIRHL